MARRIRETTDRITEHLHPDAVRCGTVRINCGARVVLRYALAVQRTGHLRERSSWVVLTLITAGGALSGVAANLADESAITGMADLGTSPTLWVLALAADMRPIGRA